MVEKKYIERVADNFKQLGNQVKNKFYNSDAGRFLLDSDGYARTQYGTDFIPEYLLTTGQKRFNTTAGIPNLPKVETMFFVYFSINPNAQAILNKKKSLVQFLTSSTASDTLYSSSANANLASVMKTKLNDIVTNFSNQISSSLTSITNLFSKSKSNDTQKGVFDSIPNDENATSYGDYITEKYLLNQLSFELSKLVKSIDKPTINFEVQEFNEYNRKRLAYQKVSYSPVKITFWDVKENPVEQFFTQYLKIINNNFFCKSHNNYQRQIVTRKFDRGLDDWGFDLDSNFRLIDKISVVEYYMDKMMVYTYENPTFESFTFGTNKQGSFTANEINVSFKYEGFTNDLIDTRPYNTEWTENKSYMKHMVNSDITKEMANFLNVRYKDGTSMQIDTAVSFIKGVLDAPKEERWHTIKAQSLDTLRKLGFADEINLVNSLQDEVDAFKSSDNKGKYLLKMTDDPSSVLGQVLSNGSTSSSQGLLKTFS